MKNIQIIDGAKNCVYDIFAAEDDEFNLIFQNNTDIAFIDEIYAKGNKKLLDSALKNISQCRIKKSEAQGIHGVLFYGLEDKKIYYPTRKDEEAINPNGSRLR
ncbi:MAG: hypothetical protein ACRCWR_03535 [Saezia sp.]